ncbi:MAG: molecular chaperone [Sedimentisphaerales bacterium]
MKRQSQKNPLGWPAVREQWREQAISRSNCYGLLALVFRGPPTRDVVERLRTPSLAQALNYLGYDVTQELAGELEALTERLRQQYTRIFSGPGPHVSLYASVHYAKGPQPQKMAAGSPNEGRFWGDSTVWVKHFIETTGLSFTGNWDSIPDHIAIELELMQRLTAYEAQLWASLPEQSHNKNNMGKQICQCLQTQEQFLRDHLCLWIPRFCKCVLETSTGTFYQKMTKLTKFLVLSDVENVVAAQSILSDSSTKRRQRNGLSQQEPNMVGTPLRGNPAKPLGSQPPFFAAGVPFQEEKT